MSFLANHGDARQTSGHARQSSVQPDRHASCELPNLPMARCVADATMRAVASETSIDPAPADELKINRKQTIGVVGLGLLGRGIVTCFVAHGFQVVGCDRDPARRDDTRRHIEAGLHELVEQASFPPQISSNWRDRYVDTDSLAAFSTCSFVIESVTEDLTEKQFVLDQLEDSVSTSTLIASNTSSLRISDLQAGRRRPERIVGMHWAEPAHITRFMEVIPGDQTSEGALQKTLELARWIGKDPCLVAKDVPAFIVNRIGYAIYREAAYLLDQGVADAETIDRAFRNAVGLWAVCCGPLRWIDLTGGPAVYGKALARVIPELSSSPDLPLIFRRMMESGAHDVANGRGFYGYTAEEAKRWEEAFRKHVWKVREQLDKQFPLDQLAKE